MNDKFRIEIKKTLKKKKKAKNLSGNFFQNLSQGQEIGNSNST